jgi:hypothetical protein
MLLVVPPHFQYYYIIFSHSHIFILLISNRHVEHDVFGILLISKTSNNKLELSCCDIESYQCVND